MTAERPTPRVADSTSAGSIYAGSRWPAAVLSAASRPEISSAEPPPNPGADDLDDSLPDNPPGSPTGWAAPAWIPGPCRYPYLGHLPRRGTCCAVKP